MMTETEQHAAPPADIVMAEKDAPEHAVLALTPVGMAIDQPAGSDAPAATQAVDPQQSAAPAAGDVMLAALIWYY